MQVVNVVSLITSYYNIGFLNFFAWKILILHLKNYSDFYIFLFHCGADVLLLI